MVRLIITLSAQNARHAEALLEGLRFLVPGTRLVPGCLESCAWMDADTTVHYVEEWATDADVQLRVRSDSFTSLMAVVEFASDAQAAFHFVAHTRGLDYVTEVRERAQNREAGGTSPEEQR